MTNAILTITGILVVAALVVGYDIIAEYVNRRRAHKH